MEKLQLLKVRLVVKQERMSPNDAEPREWLLPISSIAKLERKHSDVYTVTLRADCQSLLHERYDSLEAHLPTGTIEIVGK